MSTPSHSVSPLLPSSAFFFFNDTATTEIYTLSLHDALPISSRGGLEATKFATGRIRRAGTRAANRPQQSVRIAVSPVDRKSTRLNSSHVEISYAVFCLKKKK